MRAVGSAGADGAKRVQLGLEEIKRGIFAERNGDDTTGMQGATEPFGAGAARRLRDDDDATVRGGCLGARLYEGSTITLRQPLEPASLRWPELDAVRL